MKNTLTNSEIRFMINLKNANARGELSLLLEGFGILFKDNPIKKWDERTNDEKIKTVISDSLADANNSFIVYCLIWFLQRIGKQYG